MKLPDAAHLAQPWRIHALTPDFRLEDVWALPRRAPRRLPPPGGADRRRRPVGGRLRVVRALFAIRWKLGELFGWDDPDELGALPRCATACRRTCSKAAGPEFRALPFSPLYLHRRRVGGRDRQPHDARRDAPRLGARRRGRLPWPDGRAGQAQRAPRRGVHGRDPAVPAPARVPADAARARAPVGADDRAHLARDCPHRGRRRVRPLHQRHRLRRVRAHARQPRRLDAAPRRGRRDRVHHALDVGLARGDQGVRGRGHRGRGALPRGREVPDRRLTIVHYDVADEVKPG